MNYFSLLERYHESRGAIHELLQSIITGVAGNDLLSDEANLQSSICTTSRNYPFVDILFTLDEQGTQSSSNFSCESKQNRFTKDNKGLDRSYRPYYLLAKNSDGAVITEPYLSSASKKLCISASIKILATDARVLGFIVLDIDLAETVEFLMGDILRKRFTPLFKITYTLIVAGLFGVVILLMMNAYQNAVEVFQMEFTAKENILKPFRIIVFLTLALAVFDLGKTILEEEVLMHKDIFRHSSTRRTITRFVSAILIALLIEALLLMFKTTIGYHDNYMSGVWMMFAAVGLLIGLGLYVYLGARAEQILLSARSPQRPDFDVPPY